MPTLDSDDALAKALVRAIHEGNVTELARLMSEQPGLAKASISSPCKRGGSEARSLLHIATDWPGNFPNGAATAAALIAAGADANARFVGGLHAETPLHWAASSNDVAVLDSLLDGGADIEAMGAVIGGGTPLADAVAFGQWDAARRLVERGARANLWQAAALGLTERVAELIAESPPPAEEITKAFWCACHGGQRVTAEILLTHGADRDWIGYDHLTPLDAARRSQASELVSWLERQGAKSAKHAG